MKTSKAGLVTILAFFNAYFKSVRFYAGGYGNFWITECPKYFPLIEQEVYYKRTWDNNFKDNN